MPRPKPPTFTGTAELNATIERVAPDILRLLAGGAPRKLGTAQAGGVSFELDPKGDEVLLTVVHRRLPDRATLLKVAAGGHAHLDILVARATGETPAPFRDGWSRLRQDYDRRLPAWRNPTGANLARPDGRSVCRPVPEARIEDARRFAQVGVTSSSLDENYKALT